MIAAREWLPLLLDLAEQTGILGKDFRNLIERDGISHRHSARFVLIGTMNPEEGELRPQMVTAVQRCRAHAATALLTNNIVTGSPHWSSGGSFAELQWLYRFLEKRDPVGRAVKRRLLAAGTAVTALAFIKLMRLLAL